MKRLAIYLFAVLLLAGCKGGKEDARATLLVSIEPQRKILEEIVGDRFRVESVLGKGGNPETYEPSMSQRMTTADASAYFHFGMLPFESAIAQSVNSDALVVNTAEGISLLTGTHSHAEHEGGAADPHVWTSLRNGKIIAKNMLDAVIGLDPDNASEYTANYDKLVSRLDSLDAAVASRLSGAGVHAFAVWHPSMSYFANDYGLHQIAVSQESKEISPSVMREIIEDAKEDGVKVFFFQKEFDSRQAEGINKEIGSRLVITDPMAYDWEHEIILLTDELTKE